MNTDTELNNKPIIVDLNQSLSAYRPSSDNLLMLQQDALSRITELLCKFKGSAEARRRKKSADDRCEDDCLFRYNNTIFIHGERGAGKTTFLCELLKKYRASSKYNDDDIDKKICPIPLIDPTLTQTHQHILVDIIAKLHQLVMRKLSRCCEDDEEYKRFHNALEKVAEGLKLLNQEKGDHEPSDASWFLNKALEQSGSGQGLEQAFHRLIDIMQQILCVDLFMIAIDDIDTDADKAKEVLEVIRRYLTHPGLVVMVSGDLKLYSHVIQVHQADKLSSKSQNSAKNEYDEVNKRKMVEHLEQQYLNKVLPVEQRIQLKKLDEICETKTIFIKHTQLGEESTKIKELIEKILSSALYIKEDHLKLHIKFLLNQPVRSVLQILKYMIENCKYSGEYSSVDLKRAVFHNFAGVLVGESIQPESLAHPSPHSHTIGYELFKVLHTHGELETGFYARPGSGYDQDGLNAAKLFISATMASLFSNTNGTEEKQHISLALRLMLVGGASACIYSNYIPNEIKNEEPIHIKYLNYIGLHRNEQIIDLAAHFSPIIFCKRNQKHPRPPLCVSSGVIQISSRISCGNTSGTLSNYIAAKAILVSAHHIATASGRQHYISIYKLLAAMAELLGLDNERRNIDIFCATRTYTYPAFLETNGSGSGNNTGDFTEVVQCMKSIDDKQRKKNENESGSENFATELSNYLKVWFDNQPPVFMSSLLIGKIWSRLHYSLNRISEMTENIDRSKSFSVVKKIFSPFVWATINSSLVEECYYRFDPDFDEKYTDIVKDVMKKISQDRNIDGTSSKDLTENLKELLNIVGLSENSTTTTFRELLPFTYHLICCPLLWPFFQEGGESLVDEIKKIDDTMKSFKYVLGIEDSKG